MPPKKKEKEKEHSGQLKEDQMSHQLPINTATNKGSWQGMT